MNVVVARTRAHGIRQRAAPYRVATAPSRESRHSIKPNALLDVIHIRCMYIC